MGDKNILSLIQRILLYLWIKRYFIIIIRREGEKGIKWFNTPEIIFYLFHIYIVN